MVVVIVASTLLKLLQTFATHGLPCTLVSDNGTAFTSQEFQTFCKINGIKHIRSAPYHSASCTNTQSKTEENPDLETRMFHFLSCYRVTPQTTSGQTPAEMMMTKRPRFRLDLAYPGLDNRVLHKQTAVREHQSVALSPREFYAGDAVYVMNFAGTPKCLPGVLEIKLGPVSFTVELIDGRVRRRHIDHIRLRIPEESGGDAGTAPPVSTGVRAFVKEEQERVVHVPNSMRS